VSVPGGSGPIAFVSHFRVKEGALDAVREMGRVVTERIRAQKPGTAAMAAYLSDDGTRLSIVHVFPDASAMDAHFEGADERATAAYEHIVPEGWEIYGPATATAVEQVRREAAAVGVTLSLAPEFLGGFLRTPDRG